MTGTEGLRPVKWQPDERTSRWLFGWLFAEGAKYDTVIDVRGRVHQVGHGTAQ